MANHLIGSSSTELLQRGFEREEFELRTHALQRKMQTSQVDVALFTAEPEVRYYTGFFTQFWQSPTRPWFLVIPQQGAPVAVIPTIGEALMSQTWVSDIRSWSSPAACDDGVSLLADTIVELAGSSGNLGMLRGRESTLRMPLADYEALCKLLPGFQHIDITDSVQSLLQIKSAAEINKISVACAATGQAFAALPGWIADGMTEREVFQRFKQHCIECGIDDVSYLVGAARAGGYDDIIAPPTERKIAAGDVLILDTGSTVDGYFCDYDRNFAVGMVDNDTSQAYQLTHESIDAALAMIAPGVSCAEIYDVMQSVLNPQLPAGGNTVGRMGHGLGMQLTESPSITPFDHTTMKPGMVMTLEPGLPYGDGKIMVHEENIVITETGASLLTNRAEPNIVIV